MNNNLSLIPPKTPHTKVVANVKDVYLKTKLEVLLNNWCVQKTNNEYIFFKHFNSNRKGVINQLILSGNDYDGVYEFEIFGHDLKMRNVFDRSINDLVIKIESSSNYDLAIFNKGNTVVSVSRKNLSEKEFGKEIAKQLSRLSTFDFIRFIYPDKTVVADQQQLGELKFRKKVYEHLKQRNEQPKTVQFVQKKRQYSISRLDLGEDGFRNELFKRQLITLEEYRLFTSQNKEFCSKAYKEMKKIEII